MARAGAGKEAFLITDAMFFQALSRQPPLKLQVRAKNPTTVKSQPEVRNYEKDLAYRLVKTYLAGSAVPLEFIQNAFKDSRVKIEEGVVKRFKQALYLRWMRFRRRSRGLKRRGEGNNKLQSDGSNTGKTGLLDTWSGLKDSDRWVFSQADMEALGVESPVFEDQLLEERTIISARYETQAAGRERIEDGRRFFNEHNELLQKLTAHYGVDAALIVAIVGIETDYGRFHAEFPVFNSYYTIIHRVPRRTHWAAQELGEFLKLCYARAMDTQQISGSYAGAFGYGQFIPSSFNRFAVDYDGDGLSDPYGWPDVLASIAHYFIAHGYDTKSADFARGSANWKAIYAYNHDENYVRAVLRLREGIIKPAVEML